eukprot:6204956-Pleurochrysis_carterae.AAC.3
MAELRLQRAEQSTHDTTPEGNFLDITRNACNTAAACALQSEAGALADSALVLPCPWVFQLYSTLFGLYWPSFELAAVMLSSCEEWVAAIVYSLVVVISATTCMIQHGIGTYGDMGVGSQEPYAIVNKPHTYSIVTIRNFPVSSLVSMLVQIVRIASRAHVKRLIAAQPFAAPRRVAGGHRARRHNHGAYRGGRSKTSIQTSS